VDLKNTIELTKVNIVITERVSNYNEFTIPLKIKLKNKDQGAWTVEFRFAIVLVH
jgi:hypothetical protein